MEAVVTEWRSLQENHINHMKIKTDVMSTKKRAMSPTVEWNQRAKNAKFFSRQTTSAVGVVGRQSLGFARAVPPPGSRKSTFGSSSSSSAVKPPRR
ncbi:hypothetical protein M569_08115 [Genlisea aurea]|uniref:Uncharacterized protein n=1 Tax=Genlisea aurea TaxID=192259 RepID=S8E313_9LAMI|nr:hypothetical protein M569_08115 [Genlisea aurea]